MKISRSLILFIGDIISFGIGFLLFILVVFRDNNPAAQIQIHLFPLLLLTILWMMVLFIFNFYDIKKSKPNLIFLRNYGFAALVMLGIGFAFFYINPQLNISPKTNLVIFEGLSLVILLVWRRLFYLTTINTFHTRFAIVCTEEKFHTLISEIESNPQLGYDNRGTFQTLTDFVASAVDVDMLIVNKTSEEETELLEKILASHVEVIDLPEAYEQILYKIPVDFIDNSWIIRSISKTAGMGYQILARMVSIIFAIIIIIATLPVTLFVAVLIKLEDRGPIFIRQERTGLHGKVFKLYKFRSMIALGADGQAEDGKAVWSSGHTDPRITKVGNIIRRLHIDEIPQMINVLKGDLTLVGPRPERPEFVADLEKQIPYYFMRHAIKPGFTGWAQIKFRYARTVMDSREKFEYDLYYLKNRNLFLDFGIILKTVQIIFTH